MVRSVKGGEEGEGGSKAELGLAQTATFGEIPAEGFSRYGPGQGGTWVTCGRGPQVGSSSANQAAGHPW